MDKINKSFGNGNFQNNGLENRSKTIKGIKITNKWYRQFLETGIILTLDEKHIEQALFNIKGNNDSEGKALVIALYYTGARPVEILQLKGKDITRDGMYIMIRLEGAKKGLPRVIYLKAQKPMVKQLWEYSKGIFPDFYLFYHYIGKYIHTKNTKNGPKEYKETTQKLYYYFKKWFKDIIEEGISPYYLRHNRFSKLSEKGLSMDEIRIMKGAKTMNSVYPYVHMSSAVAKKTAGKND